MQTRKRHAIQFKLKSQEHHSVIVWHVENRKSCCRLINSLRTWITAKVRDSVLPVYRLMKVGNDDLKRVSTDLPKFVSSEF